VEISNVTRNAPKISNILLYNGVWEKSVGLCLSDCESLSPRKSNHAHSRSADSHALFPFARVQISGLISLPHTLTQPFTRTKLWPTSANFSSGLNLFGQMKSNTKMVERKKSQQTVAVDYLFYSTNLGFFSVILRF